MGDDRDESAVGTDEDERCAHCGASIDVTTWHPLLSRIEDGDVTLYPFCSVDCRDAWLDE